MTQIRHQLRNVDGSRSVEIADVIIAGRNPECDLVLTDGSPSRRHAQLSVRPDGVWVEDLGSTNGTFVNGREVVEPVRISNGDRVAFDTEEYIFISEADVVDPNATVVVRRERPAPAPGEAALPSAAPTPGERAASGVAGPPGAEPQSPPEPPPSAQQQPASEPPRSPEPPPPAAKPPPAEPPPAEKPPSPPESPRAAPAPEVVRGQADSAHRPGSWADPENQNAQGTRLFNPEELKKLGAGVAAAPGAGEAAAVDMPYLQVATGPNAGRGLKLAPGGEANVWEIGTDNGRDIVLKDDGVSGFHAKIVNEGARWKLIDQMSANGTFVNGQKSNVSYLKDGDRIRFGPVECVFRLPVGTRAKDSARRRTLLIGALSFVVTVLVLVLVLFYLG
jgi:pSer/pThr/pTyr-binding forkhead associated (FHA) protein